MSFLLLLPVLFVKVWGAWRAFVKERKYRRVVELQDRMHALQMQTDAQIEGERARAAQLAAEKGHARAALAAGRRGVERDLGRARLELEKARASNSFLRRELERVLAMVGGLKTQHAAEMAHAKAEAAAAQDAALAALKRRMERAAGVGAATAAARAAGARAARRSSAEHLNATKALRYTATVWMLIAAESLFAKF